tara:strand:+ start:593 stop:1024 length:432 start_codon:yes stop_codon:yes gene_type:complete
MDDQVLTLLDLETSRCKDFWYAIFFNPTVRNNVFFTVLEIVQNSFKDCNLSNRLHQTMQRLRNKQSNTLVKHFLIFFAMDQEREVQDYVLCSIQDKQRKEEVRVFISTTLRTLTEDLLNGKLSSCQHYVDEVRNQVTISIGFA